MSNFPSSLNSHIKRAKFWQDEAQPVRTTRHAAAWYFPPECSYDFCWNSREACCKFIMVARVSRAIFGSLPMLRLAGILSTCSLCAAVLIDRPPELPGHMTSEAYVWQSPGRPEVVAAMHRAEGKLDHLHVLAAEVAWRDQRLVINRLPGPPAGVAAHGKVLRLGQSTATLVWTEDRVAGLIDVVQAITADGSTEVQVDYDCPSRRLEDYLALLDRLQSAVPTRRIVFTALPDWLDSPRFVPLARAYPGYVLQVHALRLPDRVDAPVVLCDPHAAGRAIRRAAAIGVPFRVALPTYGSEILRDATGRVIDVVSEDLPQPGSGAMANRTSVMADAPALSALVAGLQANHPRSLTGLVWFRLPVAGDRRNWTWETFEAVRHGQPVAAHLEITAAATGSGSHDIILTNAGNAVKTMRLVGTAFWRRSSKAR